MKALFATHNQNKVREVALALPSDLLIESLTDIGFTQDVPETRDTIEGNALQKVEYLADYYKGCIFSDDTGLEVAALENRPGVLSARFAGADRSDTANMDLVLELLGANNDRSARFRTVFALLYDSKLYTFEGICDGTILDSPKGNKGFGYDPIFQPVGSDKSFGQMDSEEKNRFSHRVKALQKLTTFLSSVS